MSFKMGGKGFKKVKDHKDHAILRHHDGHEIKIDKKGLSPKMREMLAALPMGDEDEAPKKVQRMAAGGAVQDGTEEMSDNAAANQVASVSADHAADKLQAQRAEFNAIKYQPEVSPEFQQHAPPMQMRTNMEAAKQLIVNKRQEAAAQEAIGAQKQAAADETANVNAQLQGMGYAPLPTPAGGPAPTAQAPAGLAVDTGAEAPAADPDVAGFNAIATQHMGANAPGGAASPGMGMQAAGIRNEANALGALGDAQAKEYEQSQKDHELIMNDWTKRQDAWKARLDAQEKDITSQKIDPERYMKQHGSLMMTIGMALGSIGQAFTGENAPMKMIQSRIDADINAQKAELGKQETLYSRNLERYKDEASAVHATQADMAQIAGLKISALAAKSQNPIMQAKAQQMLGALQAQQAAAIGAGTQAHIMGDFEAATRQYPSKMKEGIAAIRKIGTPDAIKRADDLESKAVYGYGFASTPPVAEKLRESAEGAQATKKGLATLMELGSKPMSSWTPQDRAKADSTRLLLQGALRTAVLGPGTVNDGERAMLERLIANPTEIFSLGSNVQTRLKTLDTYVQGKLHDQLRLNGIMPPSTLTPAQTKDLALARKHPNAKGSSAVIRLYGDK